MAEDTTLPAPAKAAPHRPAALTEPPLARALIATIAVGFLAIVVLAPLLLVFAEGMRKGLGAYLSAVAEPETLRAMELTLFVAAVAVPANLVFGVAAAWAIAKFAFPGKAFLLTLIDLPFAVSPVVAGLLFVLLFGGQGVFGPALMARGIEILFSPAAMILATVFITFPFVARELIPVMQTQGAQDEEAALSLGASPMRTFLQVTLPNIRWGLLYGVLLCTARAMGEFGAVSLVSGHIVGYTNTLPLHVEILYNDNKSVAAFAAASLLAMLALVTLGARAVLEAIQGETQANGKRGH
jgi:sulfate/thiosulfate transport system permease protein